MREVWEYRGWRNKKHGNFRSFLPYRNSGPQNWTGRINDIKSFIQGGTCLYMSKLSLLNIPPFKGNLHVYSPSMITPNDGVNRNRHFNV